MRSNKYKNAAVLHSLSTKTFSSISLLVLPLTMKIVDVTLLSPVMSAPTHDIMILILGLCLGFSINASSNLGSSGVVPLE